MLRTSDSTIIVGVTRFIVPVIQIFAFYIIFHGHYSPGGGFQGGAMLAASILLQRIVVGDSLSHQMFPLKLGILLGVLGLLIFAGVGAIGLESPFRFLDYAALPFDMDAAALRYFGILLVEIGVAFTVLGTLVLIYDQIVSEGKQ